MKVLLVHPEDSPLRGPWSRERWDLVVDLGRSDRYSEQRWSEYFQCLILRLDCFRQGVADARLVQQIFSAGRGRLIDQEGIDWWDLTSLVRVPEALNVLALQRLAAEIPSAAQLWSTRSSWFSATLANLLKRPVSVFESGRLRSAANAARHYGRLARRFSPSQIKEIFLDKYDAGYRWRGRIASRPKPFVSPVILVPSAYGNVSRMAADYARLLPRQEFLMVATRQSARQFVLPSNVQVRALASYASAPGPTAEIASLIARWIDLRTELRRLPELHLLIEMGILDSLPGWFRDGLCARDAWREVMEREPLSGVLCGDDSNIFTRLPVLLASRRKIPTADFHHGAFDGRYLFKDMACDVYLAKNEMERDYLVCVCGVADEKIAIAAPGALHVSTDGKDPARALSLVYFSEPYEAVGMRAEEVYREMLPRLLRVARENSRSLVVKLHPFESRVERRRLVRDILGPVDASFVTVLDGPLSGELLAQTWCGITVESTTALDCWRNGICCFLCGWMSLSSFEYVQQFVRFGVGELLQNAEEIAEIPERLRNFHQRPTQAVVQKAAHPGTLQRLLTSGSPAVSAVRSAS